MVHSFQSYDLIVEILFFLMEREMTMIKMSDRYGLEALPFLVAGT